MEKRELFFLAVAVFFALIAGFLFFQPSSSHVDGKLFFASLESRLASEGLVSKTIYPEKSSSETFLLIVKEYNDSSLNSLVSDYESCIDSAKQSAPREIDFENSSEEEVSAYFELQSAYINQLADCSEKLSNLEIALHKKLSSSYS